MAVERTRDADLSYEVPSPGGLLIDPNYRANKPASAGRLRTSRCDKQSTN